MISIIASPTLSSDVRHRATSLLRSLHSAYTNDKAARVASTAPSASLAPIPDDEAKTLEDDIESGKLDDTVENKPVRTGEILRVHRIFMDQRREFAVRVGSDSRLELWDAKEGKVWN